MTWWLTKDERSGWELLEEFGGGQWSRSRGFVELWLGPTLLRIPAGSSAAAWKLTHDEVAHTWH